jgi:hypothetical protein
VLTVVSQRVKFTIELEHSTTVDFSADFAEGFVLGSNISASIFSFEFGVGHPGLNTAATSTSAQSSASNVRVGEFLQKEKQAAGKIIRPYHVPADLENPHLFTKPDFRQYKKLRDTVLTKVLNPNGRVRLGAGGNKATLLAIKLRLIQEATSAPTGPSTAALTDAQVWDLLKKQELGTTASDWKPNFLQVDQITDFKTRNPRHQYASK